MADFVPKPVEDADIPHPFCQPDESAFDDDPPEANAEMPLPQVEVQMIALSWSLRQKPNWQEKIKDETILKKWKNEALASQEGVLREMKVTEKMIDYALEELKSYAKLSDHNTGIEHACDDAVFWSTRLVPPNLTVALKSAASKLENVPDAQKDWHPGSNGLVLDLVHPSLYPIVYGRTLQKDPDNPGQTIHPEPPTEKYMDSFISEKHCWIPSDFAVDRDGKCKLVSPYINNIHPSNTALHSVIEQLVGAFVPMWERVLGAVDRTDRPDREPGERKDVPMRIPNNRCLWDNEPREHLYTTPWPNEVESDYLEWGPPEMDEDERRMNWIRSCDLPDVIWPEVEDEFNFALESRFRVVELKGRTLQVIVKLANIHLTPEKPTYGGGNWHVEGMFNERIVSTGIYYYDSDNITESSLAFRVGIRPPETHSQDDTCTRWQYGYDRDDDLVQTRGAVPTNAGMCLAFPNIYQHCVSEFELLDKTKPGHRKIVALFLVDPNNSIPSATTVAPQQATWFREKVHEDVSSVIGSLPAELKDIIVTNVDNLMTRIEAEEIRLELMKERSTFVGVYNEEVMGAKFNFCEH
ncbi:hypothetical protein DL96DRAFT_1781872 [Flagelloscypha sp. PMI_526]|nr:hypothetical protein DL96DRAFT_1781872 [Flagelloscypha sp. PMI_526]